jgi:hypothetical protein
MCYVLGTPHTCIKEVQLETNDVIAASGALL